MVQLKTVSRIEGKCDFCTAEFQTACSVVSISDYKLASASATEVVEVQYDVRERRRNPATYTICPSCAASIRCKKKDRDF